MSRTLKILHTVESYAPAPGGMPEVVRNLSELLAVRGHEVTVATSCHPCRTRETINDVKVIDFDISGNMVRGISGECDRYRQFLLSSNYDVVTSFAAQQWATDLQFPILDRIKGVKLFVPTGFSTLHSDAYRDYFSEMPRWLACYDMNIFLSNNYRDINFARDHGIENICVIPNGAAKSEFDTPVYGEARKELKVPEDHFLLLHVGSHSGQKGHADAIRLFFSARVRKTAFLMIGNQIEPGCGRICRAKSLLFNLLPHNRVARKKLIVADLGRRLTVASYHDADLFLFPSNVECSPLVLFECMASRTPFLTTDVGNAAEIVSWSGGGQVLPTRKDRMGSSRAEFKGSLQMLERLHRDAATRVSMGESGYNAWIRDYTWEHIAGRYEELYLRLVSGKSGIS